MTADRLTVETLRNMRDDDMITVDLPSYSRVLSARALASSTGRVLGCRFRTKANGNSVIIRREKI